VVTAKDIAGPMRLPFLILTPACVLLGLGVVVWSGEPVNYWHFILILIGALAAHISVNSFNEYFDYRSGLDTRTQRTPFSGGSGTLPTNPQAVRPALVTAIVTLAIVGLVGIYFLSVRGIGLLPLGLLGIVIIVIYTNIFLRSPILSLISPGLGFGTLMIMGPILPPPGSIPGAPSLPHWCRSSWSVTCCCSTSSPTWKPTGPLAA
jgi:1,4-dihydroxy-2-naphthoate octaprenyltransferase